MQRPSLLSNEHEYQIKSLRMKHEEECGRMQDELELQNSKVVIGIFDILKIVTLNIY
jgi:hypothetical protein